MDLTACRADGPRLMVAEEEVASDGFASLPVADLMVSLYNAGTVPRLVLARPGGDLLPMQMLLREATAWWSLALGTWPKAD